MTRVITKFCNVPDVRGEDGLWVKTFSPNKNERHKTRAFTLWNNITVRCKVGGAEQQRRPGYVGCNNYFKDFQYFAEWCQTQYGYWNKNENGTYWSLDKDITALGNPDSGYSPETCLFVPSKVNNLILKRQRARGLYPLGVYLAQKTSDKFASCCSFNSKNIHLGIFDDPYAAHRAWQNFKISAIEDMLADIDIKEHTKLSRCIKAYANKIREDVKLGLETS